MITPLENYAKTHTGSDRICITYDTDSLYILFQIVLGLPLVGIVWNNRREGVGLVIQLLNNSFHNPH